MKTADPTAQAPALDDDAQPSPTGSRRLWQWPTVALSFVVVSSTALSLFLRARSPMLLWPATIFDDQLFGRLASSLAAGHWLGGFDFLTLAKGPSYPLFMYVAYEAHLPLLTAEQLLYLLASGVLAVGVARIAHSRWLGAALYAAMALNPIHLGATGSRPIREVLYAELSLLLVGLVLLGLTFLGSVGRRRPWLTWLVVGLFGVAIGAVAAGYYMCREERPWLVPTLLVTVAAGIWGWRRDHPSTGLTKGLVSMGVAGVVAVATFSACFGVVAKLNERQYGAALVNDLADGEFARAYKLWQGVQVGEPRRFVPVTRAQRGAVYAISPAAAEMKPTLEGASTHWFAYSCGNGAICDDYTSAFLVWALRESATAAGHFTSEAEVQDYFGEIADDIQAACDRGELACGRGGLPLVPSISTSDLGPIMRSSWATTDYLLSFDAASPERPVPSGGSDPASWETMTAGIRGIPDQATHVADEQRALTQQTPVEVLQDVYRVMAIVAVPLAVLGVALGFFMRRTRVVALVGLALMGTVAARVAVIAVIDAVSYPAADASSYAVPGSDFLVALAVVGCWLLGSWVVGVFHAWRAPRPALEPEPLT